VQYGVSNIGSREDLMDLQRLVEASVEMVVLCGDEQTFPLADAVDERVALVDISLARA
jgi:hypothetical protein